MTKSRLSYVAPSLLAITSAALGKKEDAVKYAQEAYNRRDPFLVTSSEVWPDSRYLRKIEGFTEVRKRLAFKHPGAVK